MNSICFTMISISYNEKEDVIHVNRSGFIKLEDLMGYVDRMDKEFSTKKSIYILDKFNDSKQDDGIFKGYEDVIAEVANRMMNFELVMHAAVINSPKETAHSLIFQSIARKVENYHYQSFSTIKAAKEWLGKM